MTTLRGIAWNHSPDFASRGRGRRSAGPSSSSARATPVADALQTMKLVEARYESDARGGIELESLT